MILCLASLAVASAIDDAYGGQISAKRPNGKVIPGGDLRDTMGIAPAWKIVLRDSGRTVELVVNQFADSNRAAKFPLDSVEIGRLAIPIGPHHPGDVLLRPQAAKLRVTRDGIPFPPAAFGELAERASPALQYPEEYVALEPGQRGIYSLSADGRFLLVVGASHGPVRAAGEAGAFGYASFYDISDPKHPRRIGDELEMSGPTLLAGCVSEDGSRFALPVLHRTSPHSWGGVRVFVIERSGGKLSAPRLVVQRSYSYGLEFVGPYLLVGVPFPRGTFGLFNDTDSVSLFDLGDREQ